jgi:hypothetical protein
VSRRKYTDGRACFQVQADAREAVMAAARCLTNAYVPGPFAVTLARLVNAVEALDTADLAVAEFTGRRAQIASVRDKPRERIRVR